MADLEKDREVTYEVTEHIGIFGKDSKGWTKELNKVSWNGGPVKFDIRSWDEDHSKMSKGVTLTEEEIKALYSLLKEMEE